MLTFQCPFMPQMGHGPEGSLGFRHEQAQWPSLPHLKQGLGAFLSLLVDGVLKPCSSVQFSHVWLFATPWITTCQASLSITKSWSILKRMSIESVIPSSHLILYCPLLLLTPMLPVSGSLPMSQHFTWGGQSIGVSASASVLPMNIQDWTPLEWTGWISLQSKGLSGVFPNTRVQTQQFFSTQLSL